MNITWVITKIYDACMGLIARSHRKLTDWNFGVRFSSARADVTNNEPWKCLSIYFTPSSWGYYFGIVPRLAQLPHFGVIT